MRFLFINQYYAPDFAATAQQMSDLCERLAGLGHEVHVLASRAVYDGRDLKLAPYELLNGVHVHRVGISNHGRERFRDRLMGYASFYVKAFAKANMLPKADVVVTLTTPPMISLLGAWLRVLYRTRFVYWVMDIYPDIALKAHVLSPFGPVRTVWSALGRASYLSANRVIVLGEDMKEVLKRKRVAGHKVEVINCWASAEEIATPKAGENHFAAEHIDPARLSLMYSGNMGTCHSFDSVIEGVKQLSAEEGEGFQFLFVGGGKQRGRLHKELSGLESVRFLPYQDRERLGESLGAPDVHLITLQSRYDGLLVPSKVYGIMAAAKAVLFVGSEKNEVAQIVKRSLCGLVVPEGDPAAFADALRWMRENREEVLEMGRRGREYFLQHYDREIGVEKFAAMLERQAVTPGVRGVRILAHKTIGLMLPDGDVRAREDGATHALGAAEAGNPN